MTRTSTDLLLILLQMAPAVVISAGINFLVAYFMYRRQSNINFFPFPNTIAGDLAVTNFIQAALNYLAPNVQIEADARTGKRVPWRRIMNPPLGLVSRIASLQGRKRQLWQLLVQSEDITAQPLGFGIVAKRLLRSILRGLFIGVFLFLITWSLSVAILCPIYCSRNIGSTWAPQGIKAVYGGAHALIELPIAAFLILLSMDVRNYDKLPTAKLNGKSQQQQHPGRSPIGNVISADSRMPIPIDTRTNEPVREEDRL